MDSSTTSVSLLHRLRAGEQEQKSWEEFVARYGGRIHDWCLNRKLSSDDAQDVTQEILLKLAGQLRSFEYDNQKSFRGWLRRMTENAIIDFLRSRKMDVAKAEAVSCLLRISRRELI